MRATYDTVISGIMLVAMCVAPAAAYAVGETTSSSQGTANAQTASQCPQQDPQKEIYASTSPQGLIPYVIDGKTVYKWNYYGKTCTYTDKSVQVQVTGHCVNVGICTCDTYKGPDGKQHPCVEEGGGFKKPGSSTGSGGTTSLTPSPAPSTPPPPPNKDAGTSALNKALAPESKDPAAQFTRSLRPGMVGEDVKALQRIVGAKEDGIYGPETKAAVAKWQEVHPELWKTIQPEDVGYFGPKSRAALSPAQDSPSPQKQSASTFAAPESAPIPPPRPQGGITERIGEGTRQAIQAVRRGFENARAVTASHYSDYLQGRRTASGRIFDQNKMTFARPLGSGPLGGTYQICSQFRCVNAVATDYGNFGPGNKYPDRGLDLSKGLFHVLGGAYNQGLLRVVIVRIQ